MENNNFNNQKHADTLLEIETLICGVSRLCTGMDGTYAQMDDKQYINLSSGAFSLMVLALDKAYDLISEAGSDFKYSHGVHYTHET